MKAKNFLSSINLWIEEFYFVKYKNVLKREQREIDDFFMIIVFSEIMGIQNPFSFYSLELLPELMPKFHQWHKRMGIEHAFFDNFPCTCCC